MPMLKAYSDSNGKANLKQNDFSYNIHDLVSLRIRHRDAVPRSVRNFAHLKFAWFAVQPIEAPDIWLEIGAFTPQNQGCQVVDNKFWVKENYIYYKGSLSAGVKQVEITGFESGKTRIRYEPAVTGVKSYFTRDLLVQNILLLPLLKFKLRERGWYLLHGGGVTDGEGTLFIGANDSFKTRVILDLLQSGRFQFLGDDLILVNRETLRAFPEHVQVLDFRYRHGGKPGLPHKMRFLLSLLGSREGAPLRVPVAQEAPFGKIVTVYRTNRSQTGVEAVPASEALATAIRFNEEMDTAKLIRKYIHVENFAKYLFAYTYVFPSNRWMAWENSFEKEMMDILAGKPCHRLQLPYKYKSEAIDSLQAAIVSKNLQVQLA